VGAHLKNITYQNALPYSLRSSSFEWFLTVVKAFPVAFLWYVFLEESPPWLVSVILYRAGTLMIRNDDCDWNEVRLEQDVVLKTMGGCVQGEGKRQGNLRTNLETEFMNSVRILKSGYGAGSVMNNSAK
jgi:hypothetical protein